MSIQASCSHCGETYVLDDAMLGKKAKCKSCQNIFRIQPGGPAQSASRPAGPSAPGPGPANSAGQAKQAQTGAVRKNPAARVARPASPPDDDLIHELDASDEIGLPAYQRQEPVAVAAEPQGESLWEMVRPGSKLGRRDWKKARQGYLLMGIPAALCLGGYLAPFPIPFMLVFWIFIAIAAASMFSGAVIAISASRNVQVELVKSILLGGLVCLMTLNLLLISSLMSYTIIRFYRYTPSQYSAVFDARTLVRTVWYQGPVSRLVYPSPVRLRDRDR